VDGELPASHVRSGGINLITGLPIRLACASDKVSCGSFLLHKIIAFAFALLLLTTGAFAQVPTSGNVFLGYSYMSADLVSGNRTNLNGWNGSLEGKLFPFVGIVADFSGNYGTQSVPATVTSSTAGSVDVSLYNVLFGPRVSFSAGKFKPFAQVLVGVSHLSESASGSSNSDNSFAYALGGGLDYRLISPVSWRVQVDLLRTGFFSTTQDNVRVSTGLVLHF
jgi:opacity protein-like surface antigen